MRKTIFLYFLSFVNHFCGLKILIQNGMLGYKHYCSENLVITFKICHFKT